MPQHHSVAGHRDFRRLWTGQALSQLGSAVGSVALPVVAVVLLGSGPGQVAAISVTGALATAVAALPTGAWVETRRKRPLMVTADLVRAAALTSVPVAWWLGGLTVVQLCVVAAFTAVGQLLATTAAQAHLLGLVGRKGVVDANGRLQSTQWLALTVGPSGGGLLVTLAGPLGAVLLDAVSFLAGVIGVRAIRAPEQPPPPRPAGRPRWAELTGGLRYVRAHPTLGPMLLSWTLFAGSVAWVTPVATVLYLRDLGAAPWQYGLLMGLPSLGGLVGSRLARQLVQRSSPVGVVWWASMLRGPWQLVIPLAPAGGTGLLVCGLAFTGVLLTGSAANAAMAAHRQLATPPELVSRVSALWSLATVAVAPLGAAAGGLLAATSSTRLSLLAGAVVMCAAAVVLPRRDRSA